MTADAYALDMSPPVPPDRITRRDAAALLEVSLGRFDVIARKFLREHREHNRLTNRTTYSRAAVEQLARERRGE